MGSLGRLLASTPSVVCSSTKRFSTSQPGASSLMCPIGTPRGGWAALRG
jgi:hypothetical protein